MDFTTSQKGILRPLKNSQIDWRTDLGLSADSANVDYRYSLPESLDVLRFESCTVGGTVR